MTLIERIGLDLGTSAQAAELGSVAAEAGAGLVRVRFPLGKRCDPDARYLEAARSTVSRLRAAGLRTIAVVDGSLTVAPEGLGTFAERPPEGLAQAWLAELVGNAKRLAEAIGGDVSFWEVLPEPNIGSPPRIAPGRWAEMLGEVGGALRQGAPGARIVSGGLTSAETDSAVDYLRSTYRSAEEAGCWAGGIPPFDLVGLHLALLPDGGPSEEVVATAIAERVRRLWLLRQRHEDEAQLTAPGILVTGIHWDATRVGEEVQARNVWTALDTLTTDETVAGVVWSSLLDEPTTASGLLAGTEAASAQRRPAWSAFHDFADYAQQISPPSSSEALLASATEPASIEAEDTVVTFRLPDAADVLAEMGLEGAQLQRALDAVEAKYGDLSWLPPGRYSVRLPAAHVEPTPTTYTNQDVITALYRAAGGTWELFERCGLTLSELTAHRGEQYVGPPIESLELSAEELQNVLRELESE